MLNERVEIVIRGRKLTVEMEGLTPMEINSLSQQVEGRMAEVEKDSGIPDSGKLAVLTAMEFAAEIWRLKAQQENRRLAEERKVDELIVALQNAIEAK